MFLIQSKIKDTNGYNLLKEERVYGRGNHVQKD